MAMHATKDNRPQTPASRDRPHRELVNRPLQFHKCSQLFIRTHNELAPNGDVRAGALWNEFARQSAERGQILYPRSELHRANDTDISHFGMG
jgi:hypothetical protein